MRPAAADSCPRLGQIGTVDGGRPDRYETFIRPNGDIGHIFPVQYRVFRLQYGR